MARTYVVTGAASEIGAATVAALRRAGHRAIGVDQRDTEVIADLASPAGRTQMVDAIQQRTDGVLDAVIACAGTVNQGRVDVQVNFFGAVASLDGLRPMLAAGTDPRAVAVTSVAVLDLVDEQLVDACLAHDEDAALAAVDSLASEHANRTYSSSKRALARWVRNAAISDPWAGAGISLNTIGPGIVRTPMTSPILDNPKIAPFLLERVPMPFQGILAPEAIAHHLMVLTDPHMLG